MATADWEEDEWELLNDDGFVYKRKKRPRLDPTTTTSTSSAPTPPPDPAAEEKNRRDRKKRALTKLREKYQKEIDQWEQLSNMLKALQEKSQNQQQCHDQTMTASDDLPRPSEKSSDSASERLLDDLLRRAEAEEAVIQSVSNLCDMAEAICNLQEESMKQSLLDLPVWESPRELMASLCDD